MSRHLFSAVLSAGFGSLVSISTPVQVSLAERNAIRRIERILPGSVDASSRPIRYIATSLADCSSLPVWYPHIEKTLLCALSRFMM